MAEAPSFDEVYANYHPNCYKWAHHFRKLYNDTHDLDDLFQQATIGLWRAYRTCTDWQTFTAYAEKFMFNEVASYCRQCNYTIRLPLHGHFKKRYANKIQPSVVRSLDAPARSDDEDGKTFGDTVPCGGESIEDVVVTDAVYGGALAKLPDKEFAWIGLLLMDVNVTEFCRDTGTTESSAWNWSSKGRKRLRQLLDEERAWRKVERQTREFAIGRRDAK